MKKHIIALFSSLMMSGCTSYTITEQDVSQYLNEEIEYNHELGLPGLLYATLHLDDVAVKIGRVAENRIDVEAAATGELEIFSQDNKELDLLLNFSAIPFYDKDRGAIYLKNVRLEKLDSKSYPIDDHLQKVVKPLVSVVSLFLTNEPVYKLKDSKLAESLIKAAEPNLLIKNNSMIIDFND